MSWPWPWPRPPLIVVTIDSKPPYAIEIVVYAVLTIILFGALALLKTNKHQSLIERVEFGNSGVKERAGLSRCCHLFTQRYEGVDSKAAWGAGDIREVSDNFRSLTNSFPPNSESYDLSSVDAMATPYLACKTRGAEWCAKNTQKDIMKEDSNTLITSSICLRNGDDVTSLDDKVMADTTKSVWSWSNGLDDIFHNSNDADGGSIVFPDMVDFITNRYQSLMKASLAGHKLQKDPETSLLMETDTIAMLSDTIRSRNNAAVRT